MNAACQNVRSDWRHTPVMVGHTVPVFEFENRYLHHEAPALRAFGATQLTGNWGLRVLPVTPFGDIRPGLKKVLPLAIDGSSIPTLVSSFYTSEVSEGLAEPQANSAPVCLVPFDAVQATELQGDRSTLSVRVEPSSTCGLPITDTSVSHPMSSHYSVRLTAAGAEHVIVR